MSNNWFQFKQFKIFQDRTAMKVGVDSVLLGALTSFQNPETVLDIGTGTGLLAFMAAQRTRAYITAVEIEDDAYRQCIENIKFNKKENRINVIHDSFQNFAEKCKTTFDHIICNPPYFNNSYISEDHKRNTARQNFDLSFEFLFEGVRMVIGTPGFLSIVIPFENAEQCMQLSERNGICCFRKINVFPKKDRQVNRCILEFSTERSSFSEEKIIIRDSKSNKYTEQYKTLTKDFYLGL